jgi:hypothetical protein
MPNTRKARIEKEAAGKAVKRALQEQAEAALREEEEVITVRGRELTIPVGPVQKFIQSSDPNLRLARITKVIDNKTFTIKFSENGKEMQGRYTGGKKNMTRKQKTAGRRMESELLPQVANYVIVDWDEEAARNNSAKARLMKKYKGAAAHIVAIIPQTEKKIESMVIKVANHAAKQADAKATLGENDDAEAYIRLVGSAKPWGLEDPLGVNNIFLRDQADENALEREKERVVKHKAEKAAEKAIKEKELQEAKAARMTESAKKVIAAELEGKKKKKKTRKNARND